MLRRRKKSGTDLASERADMHSMREKYRSEATRMRRNLSVTQLAIALGLIVLFALAPIE